MSKEELKELREINKNLSSMKTLIIAQAQLEKTMSLELKLMRREFREKRLQEVQHD